MTGNIKGEVPFKVADGPLAGDYILLLDFNALCDLEAEFPGLMDGTAEIRGLKAMRRIIHAGFAEYHAGLSERDVGRIIHAVGLEEASDKMAESMKASFGEAGAKTGDPRTARPSPGAGTAP